jgi:hypothetical protein
LRSAPTTFPPVSAPARRPASCAALFTACCTARCTACCAIRTTQGSSSTRVRSIPVGTKPSSAKMMVSKTSSTSVATPGQRDRILTHHLKGILFCQLPRGWAHSAPDLYRSDREDQEAVRVLPVPCPPGRAVRFTAHPCRTVEESVVGHYDTLRLPDSFRHERREQLEEAVADDQTSTRELVACAYSPTQGIGRTRVATNRPRRRRRTPPGPRHTRDRGT